MCTLGIRVFTEYKPDVHFSRDKKLFGISILGLAPSASPQVEAVSTLSLYCNVHCFQG